MKAKTFVSCFAIAALLITGTVGIAATPAEACTNSVKIISFYGADAGTTNIFWEWEDLGFSTYWIKINGVNKGATVHEYYYASGLQPHTSYTIEISATGPATCDRGYGADTQMTRSRSISVSQW